MRNVAFLCLSLAATVVGCSAGENPDDGDQSTSESIVHGTPSTSANDATVLLLFEEELCSGSLLAPNLVLTARHCLTTLKESATDECGHPTSAIDPRTMSVHLGVHPNTNAPAAVGKKLFIETGAGCSHDLALVLLDRNIVGAKIAKLNTTKVTLGEAASTSGYGEDGKGKLTNGRFDRKGLKVTFVGPGTYEYATKQGKKVAFVLYDGEIATGESTCFGDSGGPLFDGKGLVIGTTWRGPGGTCIDEPSSYSAVASHLSLIKQAAQASGHTIAGITP